MPTFFPSHGAVVSLDNAGGTPTDISTTVQEVSLPDFDLNTGVFNNLGGKWSDATQGGLRATMTMKVFITTGAAEAFALLEAWILSSALTGRNRTITIDSPDSSSGSKRYTGEWSLQKLTPSGRVANTGDPMTATATFVNNGTITPSTL